jgi:hypothetical protein
LNRQPSRGQIRRAAIRAFHERVRSNVSPSPMRPPELGETPLSNAEVAFALSRGLVAPRARAFAEGTAL